MKVKVSSKVKNNVVYISSYKKRNVVKAYTKTDDDWYDILRANDSDRKISFKGSRVIGKLILELHKNNDRSIYKDNYWFSKITKVYSSKQNGRIRGQIDHIFNFHFHKKIIVDGVLLKDVYEISFTENAYKVLNFEDVKIDKKDGEVKAPDTASNKSLHKDLNVSTYGHKCPSYMYDKEKEEEPLGYSSSFSNNEKLKIKSFTKTAQSKEIAAPKPTEGAISYPATNAGQGCLTIEEEKQHYGNHRNRDSSNNQALNLLEVLANSMPNLAPTTTENVPSEESAVITEQISTITQLTSEIFKAFDSKTSEKIMENCIFEELEPNKLGISIQAEFIISDHDKQKLKSCIRMAYGSDVQMVNKSVVKQKPTTSSESVRENRTTGEVASIKEHVTSYPTQSSYKNEWDIMKVKIAEYFPQNKYNHVMSVWLDKLNFNRLEGDKIIVTGSCFYVDEVFQRCSTAIDRAVVQMKKNLVLQYEGNAQRPIEFSYKQILSRR